MSYQTTETDQAVIVSPTQSTARQSVVWLHGLGADGHDFVPLVPELRLPPSLAIRFIFPHAPVRPVTINNGYVMRAWYDIKSLSRDAAEDEVGIRESENMVRQLIQKERDAGVNGTSIVIAGFSQGGAVALHTALRYPQLLGGVLALSTYLPLQKLLAAEAAQANRSTPIFMCHGSQDPIVPRALGELSRDCLRALGYDITWKDYAMEHEVCAQEIADIGRWLRLRFE
jgi:phospholipase/carboxylesterase